jgi:voltage-gated potassium channel
VTVTTVGYGDIAPQSVLGQFLAAIIMITGYAIIAVPTGIVGAELVRATRSDISTEACPACGRDGHDRDAEHCKYCGAPLAG